MSPSEAHIDYGCACGGDLGLCERLDMAGDLRILRQRLANAESTQRILRAEADQLRERIGRNALHVLDLRARRAELAERLDLEADDLTA